MSHIANETGNSWAVDAGWQYKMPVKGLSLGLAAQNLGPKMKFMDEGSSLPLTARIGAIYMVSGNILFAFDVNRQINEKKTIFCFGSEYAVFNSFFMRAGYLKSAVSGDNSLMDSDGFKTGFGLKFSGFNLDYAITPFGNIGKAHNISFGAKF